MAYGAGQGRTPVAGVKAPCSLAVLTPGSLAEPAELVLALRARHVHAAVVLLDGALALGARLRVGHDPRQVFALRRVF